MLTPLLGFKLALDHKFKLKLRKKKLIDGKLVGEDSEEDKLDNGLSKFVSF